MIYKYVIYHVDLFDIASAIGQLYIDQRQSCFVIPL